jgi:glycosyltransferase 2 family protein
VLTPNQRRATTLTIVVAALTYLTLAFWGGTSNISTTLSSASLPLLASVVGCTICGYVFRFLNWQLYLRILGITTVPRHISCSIFFSGFALGITPGKVGEVIRSVHLKDYYGISLARTSGIYLVDRLTDLLALIILASIGALQFSYGWQLLSSMATICILTALIFMIPSIRTVCMQFLIKIPRLARYHDMLQRAVDGAGQLMLPVNFLQILSISVIAWSFEMIGLWILFQALGAPQDLAASTFIYALSTIAGAVALFPGGIGLTEGVMAGLFTILNIPASIVAAATFGIRSATLWFSILLGALFTVLLNRQTRTIT